MRKGVVLTTLNSETASTTGQKRKEVKVTVREGTIG